MTHSAVLKRPGTEMTSCAWLELQTKIGVGSYGTVFKALDRRDECTVAVKTLHANKYIEQLRREIRILRGCDHPNIIACKGVFQNTDQVWIVMEYCEAGSLSDMMQASQRTFSEAQIAVIMKAVLQATEYLHTQQHIHRDIKGANILVTKSGTCKLADFGISTTMDRVLGNNHTVIGTPHWMAPEVLLDEEYDHRADIWSLGITAYELAVGEPPHAHLPALRAAFKIPTSPAPTLPSAAFFSADFHAFLAATLVVDFRHRPDASSLLRHAFIRKAAGAEVLLEKVTASLSAMQRAPFRTSSTLQSSQLGRETACGETIPRTMSHTHTRSHSAYSTVQHADPDRTLTQRLEHADPDRTLTQRLER